VRQRHGPRLERPDVHVSARAVARELLRRQLPPIRRRERAAGLGGHGQEAGRSQSCNPEECYCSLHQSPPTQPRFRPIRALYTTFRAAPTQYLRRVVAKTLPFPATCPNIPLSVTRSRRLAHAPRQAAGRKTGTVTSSS